MQTTLLEHILHTVRLELHVGSMDLTLRSEPIKLTELELELLERRLGAAYPQLRPRVVFEAEEGA